MGCRRDRRRAATRVIGRHPAAGKLAVLDEFPGCDVNGRSRCAVARLAPALRGKQVAGTRGGLGFDGSNERAGRVSRARPGARATAAVRRFSLTSA